MKKKILIVDDNEMNRQLLRRILQNDYEIIEARNGKEALSILKTSSESLSAMLLDIIMPELDGFEVLTCMRGDSELAPIPVIVTTGNMEEGAEVKALSLGANDYIMKPYNPAIIMHRLRNTINLRETSTFVNAAKRDKLTGLYNREAFFEKAEELICAHTPGFYVMACFDIDSFKVINDQYGSDKGDFVLRFLADNFMTGFTPAGGICCRIMADNFAVLYPRHFIGSPEIDRIRSAAYVLDGSIPPITFSIGRYLVDDLTLSMSAMYDRASIAETSIKGRFDEHIAWFDESMREHILREQEIISEMNTALESKQFEVWFQPQYNLSSGALIGSEALVRWRHPRKGLVPPSVFIPVFENNGFVYEVDKFVWEQTCVYLRKWLDEGRSPLPVSVNISRYDVFREDFFEFITGLTMKYKIPVSLLRLEITESAFAQSKGQIIRVTKSLMDHGFTLEIDDFGSGYSSLNTLKDVSADILKLDMCFLESTENSTRGGNILESVVRMAKWLGMSVIAEGVETQEQADFLKSIGCSYVQGYLYGMPMPVDEYEQLASVMIKEVKLLSLETVENLDNNVFWDPQSIDTLIFNTYVGGACIFEYCGTKVDMLRVNDKCVKILGNKDATAEDVVKINWNNHVTGINRTFVRNAMKLAISSGEEIACEAAFSDIKGDNTSTYLRASMRMIAHSGERYLFYCLVDDLSAQHEAEQKERLANERLNEIMSNVNGGITAVIINNDKPDFLFANEQYYAQLGYTEEQYNAEVKSAFELIHPDDRERVSKLTINASALQKPYSVVYRAIRRDGTTVWLQSNISITAFPNVKEPVQLAVANDITALHNAEQKERSATDRLRTIMNNVNSGVSALTLEEDGSVKFVFTNDRYYSIFGYTKEQFENEVSSPFDIIHKDDTKRIRKSIASTLESRVPTSYEYRCITRGGDTVILRSSASITEIDGISDTVLLSVITDITALANAEKQINETSEQLHFLNDTAHVLLSESNTENSINGVLKQTLDYFDGNRAFVIEVFNSDSIYEVCADGIPEIIGKLRIYVDENNERKLSVLNENKHIEISDINDADECAVLNRRIMNDLGISSVITVPMRRNGKLLGFVGVDNPSRRIDHIDNLKAISDYIAAVITNRDLTAELAKYRKQENSN